MAKFLSPIQRQFIDANGNPYSGAKLFTYESGTSTKTTVYKDSAGASSHANPIILNTKGEPADGSGVAYPIWQDGGGVAVKYVLAPSTDTDPPVAAISTWDNIPAINDTYSTIDQWVAGPTPTYVSGTSFTVASDYSSTFHVGRRVKTTNSGGTIYSNITAVSYAAGVTTVTVANDSGNLDSGMSAVWHGMISSINSSLPGKIRHDLQIDDPSYIGITNLTAETSPDTADELALFDTSASTSDKVTLGNFFKVINTLTTDSTPDHYSDYVVTYDASATASKKVLLTSLSRDFLHVYDEKSTGTDGGTATSGSWETRTLNTVGTNEITGASLGSNQITLPAGTYEIHAFAPAYRCGVNKAKLYNTTATADIIIGTSARSHTAGDYTNSVSIISGRFTLSVQSVLEIRHQVATTRATDGYGNAAGFSTVERYTDVRIWRVA